LGAGFGQLGMIGQPIEGVGPVANGPAIEPAAMRFGALGSFSTDGRVEAIEGQGADGGADKARVDAGGQGDQLPHTVNGCGASGEQTVQVGSLNAANESTTAGMKQGVCPVAAALASGQAVAGAMGRR
jgi:hypothetical protein